MLGFGQIAPPLALPPHHPGLLAVRFRDSLAGANAPGIVRLLEHHRAGRLRRVTPLHPDVARQIDDQGCRSLAEQLRIASRYSGPTARHARTFLVDAGARQAMADDLADRLAADPQVESVGRVPIRFLTARAGKALPADLVPPPLRNWHLGQIGWRPAERRGFRDAPGVRVAVLDSGVDVDHPALEGRIRRYVYRYPKLAALSGQDHVGHGTHVSGIIGGNDRGAELHGMCRADLRVWKIFDDAPELDPTLGLFYYLVNPTLYWRALHACIVERVDVLNLSLGGTTMDDHIEGPLFHDLLAQGTTIVAAVGNMRQNGSPRCFPAALPHVIAVGATDQHDIVAPFSSRARHLALAAPGVGIWSSLPRYPGSPMFAATRAGNRFRRGKPTPRNQRFDAWPGTSMAAPLVTGAVAVLIANRGRVSCAEARTLLMRSSDRVPGMKGKRWTPDYGAGRLNLQRLLAE